MSNAKDHLSELKRVGGVLCLDFVNTAGWRGEPGSPDMIDDYEDLVVWATYADALTDRQTKELSRVASREPQEAQAVHRRAIALREALYRAFSAVAEERPVAPEDLRDVNAAVEEAYAHLELAPAEDGFAWTWRDAEGALALPVWMMARSAAELLLSERLGRVRQCAGDRCDWLFLDASRNASRRWCDMADCGNRAKARRHYARQHPPGDGANA